MAPHNLGEPRPGLLSLPGTGEIRRWEVALSYGAKVPEQRPGTKNRAAATKRKSSPAPPLGPFARRGRPRPKMQVLIRELIDWVSTKPYNWLGN